MQFFPNYRITLTWHLAPRPLTLPTTSPATDVIDLKPDDETTIPELWTNVANDPDTVTTYR